MFTRKSKTQADHSPILLHIYLYLKRFNYVIRKLLSMLHGWELGEAVMYPTKNEYFIPEELLNICGCPMSSTFNFKKRDIMCTEYCHCKEKCN